MSQPFMKNPSRRASLRGQKPAHTVLLRMAADEARAERIRTLRIETGLKWRELAAYVGVSERSAHQWGATGAISHPNAVKLTELFREHGAKVEDDYVWRGHRPSTPKLMNMLSNGENQLDRIESKLDALIRLFAGVEDTDQQTAIAALRRLAQTADAGAPDAETHAAHHAERQRPRRAV